MNTLTGYSKKKLTDNNILTASGGHIPLEQLHTIPYRSSFELYDTLPMILSGKTLGNSCTVVTANEDTAPHSKVWKVTGYCSFYSPETMYFTPGETICIESWIMRPSDAEGTEGLYYLGINFKDKQGKPINNNGGCLYFGQSDAWTCPCDGVWYRRYNEYTIPTSHTSYNGSDGGGFFSGTVRCLINYSAGTIPTYYGGFRIYKKNVNIQVPSATNAKVLTNYFSARPTNCDQLWGDGSLRHFKATSSMTTSKPPYDAHVLHFAWDNTNKYESQLAVSTSISPKVFVRSQDGTNWGNWITLLGSNNYNNYVYTKLEVDDKITTTQSYIRPSGYVVSNTADLDHYWVKLCEYSGTFVENKEATFYIHSAHQNFRGFVHVNARRDSKTADDGTTTYTWTVWLKQISGNLPKDRFRLYYSNSGKIELWCNVRQRWGVFNCQLISSTSRYGNELLSNAWILHKNIFTSVQTLPTDDYVTLTESVNTMWISKGSTTTPIYFNSIGEPTVGTSYAKAIKGITRNGTTFTYTCIDGTTGTFTQLNHIPEITYLHSAEYTTVKDVKDALVTAFSSYGTGVGSNVIVPTSAISNWNSEDAVITSGTVYSVIKIGGGYSSTEYGQWLLSSHDTSRIGYVGRNQNIWSNIKWLATTEDVNLLKNYYWANVPISATSSTTTNPIFATATLSSTLTLAGTTSTTARINFSRGSAHDYPYNYITAPTGGIISIEPGGLSCSLATGYQFTASALQPGVTNTYTLGSSTLVWKGVYATTFVGALSGNASSATTASKLSTVSKTAWGQTYWTSDGVPISISGNMTGVGTINASGNITSSSTTTTFLKHTVSNSNGSLSLYAGINRGLYDDTNSNWILYLTQDGTSARIPKWANKGSSTLPVCFNAQGEPAAVSSIGEAYLSWGGKDKTESFGPIDAALVNVLGANRFDGLPAQCITVEYSRDGGVTWENYGCNDSIKVNLVSQTTPNANLHIGKSDTTENLVNSSYKLRVIINSFFENTNKVYTTLNKFILYVDYSSNFNTYCTIKARKQSDYNAGNNVWTTFKEKAYISGWSSYNVLNISGITTYGNKDDQYREIMFEFGIDNPPSTGYGLSIHKIYAYGGTGWINPSNMARANHLYTYDYLQNATFPAYITSTGFKKAGSSDEYVLLGGGGHRPLSSFNLSNPGNGTITINQAGTTKGTFTVNQSGNTIIELTDSNTDTWRDITDSYSGTSSTTSLSQKGGNDLYNALVNGYASSAGSASKVTCTEGGADFDSPIIGTNMDNELYYTPKTTVNWSTGKITANSFTSSVATGIQPYACTSITLNTNLNADLLDGLHLNSTTTNNESNTVMRTDGNGYANFGLINTTSGTASGTITRIYCSQDSYIRYLTPANTLVAMISTLPEGNLDVTDNTEILTSYASNNGFADTNAKNVVYKRDAVKVYNYIKDKLDSVFQAKGNYLTSRGYIGTTAVQANSAAQAVTGVTTLSMSNTLTITNGGMKVTGMAYFGGGTTYYFGSTGNINCNTLTVNGATDLKSTLLVTNTATFKGELCLQNYKNSYITFANSLNGVSTAEIHCLVNYNQTTKKYTDRSAIYFRIMSPSTADQDTNTGYYTDFRLFGTADLTESKSYDIFHTGNFPTKVKVMSTSSDQEYPVVFVSGVAGASGTDKFLYTDTTSDSCIRYNPSKSALYCGGGFYESSDERLKDFYETIEVDLDKLAKIPKKYFKWKNNDSKLEIGTSAQEIQKLYPELVLENSEGLLNIDYAKLSIIALKGIDELYKLVKDLKNKIEILKHE